MIGRLVSRLPGPLRTLAVRFDRSPIASVEALVAFVRTRAAYVAQTALFGYLKTRMGTRYPALFQDPVFAASIRQARAEVFLSCLSDATVFAVAVAAGDGRLDRGACAALAEHCYRSALAESLADLDAEAASTAAVERFRRRAARTDWARSADGAAAFAGSERDLIRHAPVIDQFKELDRAIVANSIRFRWRDVRAQFRKRVDAEALCRDWRVLTGVEGG